MGLISSFLDKNKLNFIKGRTQAELNNFASTYRKQYSLAFLSHVHDELVQSKQEHTQLLKQKDPPEDTKVIYGENLFYFDDKKWKKRFAVVRANYSLECYDSYETFMKSNPPLYNLLPTGGTILTTEERYMELVDKCLPDTDHVKEALSPPVVGMPGQFPVYLLLPYQRDYYFCFLQEAKQTKFISILSNCIRHQNQDFLKKTLYEVKAFVKAVQLYRQKKGHYESWNMLIGSNVQVLANLVMEDLLPLLEKDLLLRLKAKKMKRRMWFATVDKVYNLVQETLKEGMMALNNECRETAQKQSALISSDMDQIMSSRSFLESKLRAAVAESALDYLMQHVEPNLPAVLEEIMGPISLGFKEARQLSESMMEQLCQNYQKGMTRETLQQALAEMRNPDLRECYDKVSGLKDHIQELQQSFNYPTYRGLEHSTQIDIQQLMENVIHTFELLLNKVPQDTNLAVAMVKAKQRVLKQYDYDSSTLRKKIFREALISIILPSINVHLAPKFKKDLPGFEQYIFSNYVNFINVENVYEDILLQLLENEVSKVVKDAASMKKHNLFAESRYNFSVSSQHFTLPGSPALKSATTQCYPMPASPLLSLGEKSIPPLETTKYVEPKLTVARQLEFQAKAQPKLNATHTCTNADGQKTKEKAVLEDQVEMTTVLTAVVEETSVPVHSVKENTHTKTEPFLVAAIHTVPLEDQSSSLITEPTLKATPHTLTETIPKRVEINDTTIRSSFTAEDTTSLDQVRQSQTSPNSVSSQSPDIVYISLVLQTVSDEPSNCSETSGVAPPDKEEKKNNASGAVQDGSITIGAPTYEIRENNTTQGFTWVFEEEKLVDKAEEDEPIEVIVGPEPDKPKEPVIVICEAVKDAEVCISNSCIDLNIEAARPPDCIKEIRDLVVEVIEVEELIHPIHEN